ncbi:CocE/NonD family hydrolase [Actinoalloteichus hymeniacidonis]|uniref:Hydrolase, CocE/NonD family n=1 Tax=Actinoalloteichus hymeniacidonis TaxID=340345 RepID=A0AAC9HSJ6_9PSEU|nr:CocE/NonD family hydrolase [Actinoalloteichus hymeniacidonis]AOS64837.1 putative hydrolase, CocE/NonD family [Actinoalloteichus hymeniacidonis]MBB5907088.1 hypothetical protein [Actinoalloteichus hymeniacidonis]
MRTVASLPYTITSEENVWIPMSDGTRLSGRIWRPTSADAQPVPAILEYIPYRHRDLTSLRDSINHPYMAGHGYACVRVDIRGTGNSDGVLTDEYLEQEQQDAEEVLAWLAEQPWCDGQTGMMGISWGAFAALQVAARRPPSLRAIVIASFTDDRYGDDMHYMGGCMLSDNLAESSTMFAYATCPPDPAVVGDRWRDMWFERLESGGPWVAEWLQHQRRDDYWRHASISGDYDAVQCPVFAVCGWADGYSNAVFRLLENLNVPRKGLIGPWSHKYPHVGEPGPAIGFLQEVVCWWDYWMKDESEREFDDFICLPGEPMLRTWMQDSVPPSTAYQERPGRWVGEPSWPSPHIRSMSYRLAPYRIVDEDTEAEEREMTVQSPLSVGQFAGKWCSYNAPPDLPYDQREEDGGSLTFDSDILTEQREILGAPRVELDVTVTQPVAMIAARLSDVSPDGRATRITYGLLNLTHRDSHEDPTPMEPGKRCRVSLSLNGVAQAFPPGHRIRLSLSTSYWPLAWPPPHPGLLSVHTGTSSLILPVRPIAEPDGVASQPFGQPEGAPPIETSHLRPPEEGWTVSRDLIGYRSALEVLKDIGVVRFEDIDLEVGRRAFERYGWVADDFSSVRGETEWTMEFARGDWRVSITTNTTLTCTPENFVLHARLDAYEGPDRVFSQNWHHVVPRDLV